LEYLIRSIGVLITCCALVVASLRLFRGDFVFFFVLLFFWLCASLMSRLAQDIMLLQRLGVIGIILVLIYSLYRKKCALRRTADGKKNYMIPPMVGLDPTNQTCMACAIS
jgi:hypothetical protein